MYSEESAVPNQALQDLGTGSRNRTLGALLLKYRPVEVMALVSGWSDLPFLRIPKEDPECENPRKP
jgi:hypothetical protein